MAASEDTRFSREEIKLARFAKASRILQELLFCVIWHHLETCCFNEISKDLPLADSTVSQHLTELKNAGLIQGSIEPPRVKYCINFKNWKLARKYFKEFTKIKIVKDEKDK